MPNTFISIDDTCKLLGYSKGTVYALVAKKAIPFHQPTKRGKIYFVKEKLEDWVLSSGDRPKTEILEGSAQ